MSVSTIIVGVRDLTDSSKLENMIQLAKLCDKTGSKYPQEVMDYFGDVIEETDFPNDIKDIKERMSEVNLDKAVKGTAECEGAEIDLSKVPKDVKKIRVYQEW